MLFHGLFRFMFQVRWTICHSPLGSYFPHKLVLLRSCFWCGSTIKHKESSTQNRAATSLDNVIFHFAFKERNPSFVKVTCGDAVLKFLLGFQMVNSDCSMHVTPPFVIWMKHDKKHSWPAPNSVQCSATLSCQSVTSVPGTTVPVYAMRLGLSDWNMPEHSTPVVAVGYSCQPLLDPSLSLWAVHPTWSGWFPSFSMFQPKLWLYAPQKDNQKRDRFMAMWEDGVEKTIRKTAQ